MNATLQDTRSVFSKMPNRDVVSWNTMIAAFVQQGHAKEALELFQQMQLENVESDSISFICALNACTSLDTLSRGKGIHEAIYVSQCVLPNVLLGNALINLYGKCGSLCDARSVFAAMQHRDVVSWTAMLSALAENGHEIEALDVFHQMQSDGIKPDNVAFMAALDVCARLADFDEGQKIHSAIVKNGCGSDVMVGTALINMYGKCGSMGKARSVFGRMPGRDVVAWKTMIAAYVQNGHGSTGLDLFYQMQCEGLKPDTITFIQALDACTSLAMLKERQLLHVSICDSGYEQDLVMQNALVSMYGRCRSVQQAKCVFSSMPYRDVISWNAIITAFTENGYGKEALNLFHQMQYEDVKPDIVSFVCALTACAGLAAIEEVREIHAASESFCTQDVTLGNALINCYGKSWNVYDARSVFGRMPCRDVVSLTAMIAAYVQKGHGKEALDLFCQMQLQGIKPNNMTLVSAIDACTSLAALEVGKKIHVTIVDSEYGQDVFVGTALINMYGNCGSVHDANKAFGRLANLSVVSWTAIIAAFGQNGYGKVVLDLYNRMQLEGIKPDNAIFTCVLSACSHLGLVDDGRSLFVSISADFGTIYTIDHHVCIIDLLGRAGCLDEAEDFLNCMPFGRSVVAWHCWLSSCRMHGDVERTERAVSHYLNDCI